MSVFATHRTTRHFRSIAVFVAVCAIVAASVLTGRIIHAPLTAALREMQASPSSIPDTTPTETVFAQPRLIDWEGVVFGILAGGGGLAVRRSDIAGMFQAYGSAEDLSSISYGPVIIRGRWTGISCAYEHTIFEGRCTPVVDIDAVEILPIELE